MWKLFLFTFPLYGFLKSSLAIDAGELASQLNKYCEYYSNGAEEPTSQPSRIGKAGPRGEPGPPGYVNYTKIYEMIDKKIKDITENKDVDCTRFHSNKMALIPREDGGVFEIQPGVSGRKLKVYCDITTDDGGWMIFQKRFDGSVNFTRDWADYVYGFGDLKGEFWMGLEKLHRLTNEGEFELRIDLEDWEGNKAYAKYSQFSIGSAASDYQLLFTGYSGSAGDSLKLHQTMKFTTFDKDNDIGDNNCATYWNSGGWWFENCFSCNLNGKFYDGGKVSKSWQGVIWRTWKGSDYSIKSTEMKFRPKI